MEEQVKELNAAGQADAEGLLTLGRWLGRRIADQPRKAPLFNTHKRWSPARLPRKGAIELVEQSQSALRRASRGQNTKAHFCVVLGQRNGGQFFDQFVHANAAGLGQML
jgi:hypothetical protein